MAGPDLDTDETLLLRRKRALYRAQHRGTKEMDWMVGKFAAARLDGMDSDELTLFEDFLEQQDPEINAWLLHQMPCDQPRFMELLADIRTFNSID